MYQAMAEIEFESLLIIVSIVVGIGLTKMLESIIVYVKGDRSTTSSIYVMWFIIIFILNLEFIWNLRLQSDFSFSLFRLFIYMLGPIFLFICSSFFILEGAESLKKTTFNSFTEHRTLLFIPLLLYIFSQFVVSIYIKSETLNHPQNLFRYGAFALLIIGLSSDKWYMQMFCALLASATLILYVISTDFIAASF